MVKYRDDAYGKVAWGFIPKKYAHGARREPEKPADSGELEIEERAAGSTVWLINFKECSLLIGGHLH